MRGKFWISSILAAAVSAAALPRWAPAQPAPASANDPIQQSLAVLYNARAGTEARNVAAQRLVSIRSDASRRAVVDVLSDSRFPKSQEAVAEALAGDPDPDRNPDFVQPLMTMLATPGLPGIKASQALAIYNTGGNNPVLVQLIGIARGTMGGIHSDTARDNATLALGYMIDRDAAQTLIDLLTGANETLEIHENAAKALTNMTGNTSIGNDPQAWQNWWAQNSAKNPQQFRNDLLTVHATQLAALKRQFSDVESDFSQMLDDWYHSLPLEQRKEKLKQYLTAAEPIKRAEGARIINYDKSNGSTLPPMDEILALLQKMISDPEPRVRQAVAEAISALSDRSALPSLIAQLRVENNTSVKTALVKTLGQIGDAGVVVTLLPLLEDPHDVVKSAAAGALAALGPQLQNIPREQARQAGRQLQIIFDRTQPGSQLRQEVIAAMAQLRDDSLLPLFRLTLNNPNETARAKKEAIQGIANLKDEKSADDIVRALNDPDALVRQAACEALPDVSAVSASRKLVEMLQPGNDDPAVQDKAWKSLSSFLPQLDVDDLQAFADRFRSAGLMEKAKRCLETIRDKLVQDKNPDKLALAHQNLGQILMDPAIADYDGAVSEFDAAIAIRASQHVKPGNVLMVPLYRMRLQASLRAGKYPEAIQFANDAVAGGALEPGEAGALIKTEVDNLVQAADKNPVLLDKAVKLIDESEHIELPPNMRGNLKDERTRIQAQMDRNKGSGYTTPGDGRLNAIIGATAKRD